MGFLDLFKSSDEPTPGRIQKAIRQVTQPHGDASIRMGAADRLKSWGTAEAVAGLLRRFTVQTPSGQKDTDECQEVERMLVELGDVAIEPIVAFLSREAPVGLPARALRDILAAEPELYVTHILGVLERLDASFGSSAEQRAGLIHALEDLDDERIGAGVRRFLTDPSDDVALAAVDLIVSTGDISFRDDIVGLLLTCDDRPRVRLSVADRLVGLGWPMQDRRKDVSGSLPDGFGLDKKGRVVAF